jgi:hypothetical protein
MGLSVPYPLRFLFARRPDIMGAVLGIVYRVIATHLIRKAGFSAKRAHTGAVTLILRFGSAFDLNLHFHMLFLDGVYVERPDGSLALRSREGAHGRRAQRPGKQHRRARGPFSGTPRLARTRCRGHMPLRPRSGRRADGGAPCALDHLPHRGGAARRGAGCSRCYSLPAGDEGSGAAAGKVGGFSLHPGVAARADERGNLERLCRTISRPAVSQARLSLTAGGNVRLPAQDRVPRRHHARALRAAGFPRPAGRTGAETTRCDHLSLFELRQELGQVSLGFVHVQSDHGCFLDQEVN